MFKSKTARMTRQELAQQHAEAQIIGRYSDVVAEHGVESPEAAAMAEQHASNDRLTRAFANVRRVWNAIQSANHQPVN